MADGVLQVTDDISYQLVIDHLYIAPSGLVEARNLLIQATSATIEEGGVINLNARGYLKAGPGTCISCTINHCMYKFNFYPKLKKK
jgi:hypothetical protein